MAWLVANVEWHKSTSLCVNIITITIHEDHFYQHLLLDRKSSTFLLMFTLMASAHPVDRVVGQMPSRRQ
jgi:hypothetical protein